MLLSAVTRTLALLVFSLYPSLVTSASSTTSAPSVPTIDLDDPCSDCWLGIHWNFCDPSCFASPASTTTTKVATTSSKSTLTSMTRSSSSKASSSAVPSSASALLSFNTWNNKDCTGGTFKGGFVTTHNPTKAGHCYVYDRKLPEKSLDVYYRKQGCDCK